MVLGQDVFRRADHHFHPAPFCLPQFESFTKLQPFNLLENAEVSVPSSQPRSPNGGLRPFAPENDRVFENNLLGGHLAHRNFNSAIFLNTCTLN